MNTDTIISVGLIPNSAFPIPHSKGADIMKEFIKKHPHAIINVFGVILTVLIAIPSEISFFAFLSVVIVVKYPFILLFPFISNIIAYKAVQSGKKALAVVCSVLYGSIGGFIAVKSYESDASTQRIISIIFHIQMWLAAILAVGLYGGLYYAGSHY